MQAATSRWRRALWLLAIIPALYAYSVYSSFFATELGYVYDPATDRLFELHLTPSINTCDKWTPLTPFKYCFRGEVGNVEYQGTLEAIEANRKLGRENLKAVVENLMKKSDALLSGTAAKERLSSWKSDYYGAQINYYWTPAVPVSELLPRRLSALKDSITGESRDVIAVDVVIARRTSYDMPAQFDVVRKAVLIRGIAARRFVTWMHEWKLDELPN